MKNICLIYPRLKYPCGDPPLGLLYIASYLKKLSKHNIEILDLTFVNAKNSYTFVKEKILTKHYDIIGFSVMVTMLNDTYNLIDLIKQNSPRSIIILGGPQATVDPNNLLLKSQADAVCIGEGEETFLELANNNFEFSGIKGLMWKKNKDIINEKSRDPIINLDILPFPNRDYVSMENYFKYYYHLGISSNIKGTGILTSRGCPYKCSYCQPTLENLFGKKIRKRSPQNIVSELKYLIDKYKINAFTFIDDTFIFDKKRVREICNEIIKENLHLSWECNVRANLLDDDIIKIMKEAGLKKVSIGIESLSQRILDDVYYKKINVEQINHAIQLTKKYKINSLGYFMIGAPTETKNEIWNTIKYAAKSDLTEATFSITTPLPSTFLFEKTNNLISKKIEDFDYYKTSVYDKSITQPGWYLLFMKRIALIKFYLSTKRLKETLHHFLTLKALKKTIVKLTRF
ncbi:MAG: B12-binding domain-containing radical SAM protein [Spirochaetota bacterium]|nr:B12-binding domain-containing radical SAM protein [Spirochaetota bacterium]